jgi:hypothetical protein
MLMDLPHTAAHQRHRASDNHASIGVMTHNHWHLDPARFPQRLDLAISEPALERLEQLSRSTGRSIGDLAADLLSRTVAAQVQAPGLPRP